ncbi:MAG: hypothetical protein LH647_08110 [Leptolyngbyaceae cyanobacterium CAN_BIN12]|nr:hypothetical protein [Leptolyngbyaceae cyanobacterium CAN_BIN12]
MSPKLSELIQQAETLPLEEQLQLLSHLQKKLKEASQIVEPEAETTGQSLLNLFDSLIAGMTEKEIAQLPTDGAEQHDHYIYGIPKRPA